MPVDVVVEIGVLADIERAVGACEKACEIALDVAGGGEVFRLLPQRIGLAVLPQILRLERHDLFEMRMVPGTGFRILEYAAPHRIDQRNRRIQCLPGALDGGQVAGLGARDRQIHAVAVDIFLRFAPAAQLFLVGLVVVFAECRA